MFAYNTFNSPNLGNYSPFELTFGRKPRLLLNVDSNPDIKISRNFKEYYELLNKRIKFLQDILFNFKSQRLVIITSHIIALGIRKKPRQYRGSRARRSAVGHIHTRITNHGRTKSNLNLK